MPILLPLLALLLGLFALAWLARPLAPRREGGGLPYECGFSPAPGLPSAAYPVAFYLVGLLFTLFDLELLLLYPFGALGAHLSLLETAGALAAFLLFGAGFVYEVRSGGLELAT